MLKLSNEKDNGQRMIYDFLNNQCKKDKCLKDKMNAREFTTNELLEYCFECAEKQAEGKNSACIKDDIVFGWCKHYILEGMTSENRTLVDKVKEEVKPEPKPKPKSKPVKKEESEFNLFGNFDLSGKKTELF